MEDIIVGKFLKEKHIKFFTRTLQVLPSRYQALDSNRLTIAFFALSGLDVLNALDHLTSPSKKEIIDWIYGLQVVPDVHGNNSGKCGFRGSTTSGISFHDSSKVEVACHNYASSHITMTYTGLACLLILGDDLSRVNRYGCLQGVKSLQLQDGSFRSTLEGSESDMRFIYCACCICTILNDFSVIDSNRVVQYILKSKSYDGAFGQGPGQESHGGSTFCAISSLMMLQQFSKSLSVVDIRKLQRWCIYSQSFGFHGRPHKDDDTCYSFWIGASLKLIGSFGLCDWNSNTQFILSTQDLVIGGFGKWPQSHPDALHTYMGLCGLSMMSLYGLNPITPALNITCRACDHMSFLHRNWLPERTVSYDSLTSMNSLNSHMCSTIAAVVIGFGAVILPWLYSSFFQSRTT